jgi:hypothetical protein
MKFRMESKVLPGTDWWLTWLWSAGTSSGRPCLPRPWWAAADTQSPSSRCRGAAAPHEMKHHISGQEMKGARPFVVYNEPNRKGNTPECGWMGWRGSVPDEAPVAVGIGVAVGAGVVRVTGPFSRAPNVDGGGHILSAAAGEPSPAAPLCVERKDDAGSNGPNLARASSPNSVFLNFDEVK